MVHVGIEYIKLLPQFPKCQYYGLVPPCLSYFVDFKIKHTQTNHRTSYVLMPNCLWICSANLAVTMSSPLSI